MLPVGFEPTISAGERPQTARPLGLAIIIIILIIIIIIIIIKTAAKFAEELSQPNEKSDTKEEGIQHTKARLREVLKTNEKTK
jgi:uncharacterized protein YpmB